jgi:hypothetical protein
MLQFNRVLKAIYKAINLNLLHSITVKTTTAFYVTLFDVLTNNQTTAINSIMVDLKNK